MSNSIHSGSFRLWLMAGMAFLCLGGVGILAGCDDSGGTPSVSALAGSVTGTYTTQQANPDTGVTYTLMGTGTVVPLGQVQAAGSFQTIGFVANGNATGQLTLTSSSGAVSLMLVGPQQSGFAGVPATFHYTITGSTGSIGGTGTSQPINSSGNITLTIVPGTTAGTGQFTVTFGP